MNFTPTPPPKKEKLDFSPFEPKQLKTSLQSNVVSIDLSNWDIEALNLESYPCNNVNILFY